MVSCVQLLPQREGVYEIRYHLKGDYTVIFAHPIQFVSPRSDTCRRKSFALCLLADL